MQKEIAVKEENSIEEESNIEEENVKEITRDEMVKEMYSYLTDEYPEDSFIFNKLDDIKYDLIEVEVNKKIAFRQIIDMSFTIDENKERIKGSYERNLRAFEKLSEEYKTKYNQEIAYMNQADVTSIRTIKNEE